MGSHSFARDAQSFHHAHDRDLVPGIAASRRLDAATARALKSMPACRERRDCFTQWNETIAQETSSLLACVSRYIRIVAGDLLPSSEL